MEKQRQQDRKDQQQMMDNFMKMQIEQQNLTRAQMENVTMTNKQLMEASNRSQDISSKEMINMSKDLREVIEKSQKYNETQKGKGRSWLVSWWAAQTSSPHASRKIPHPRRSRS